jgi:adenylosuccinate synthase
MWASEHLVCIWVQATRNGVRVGELKDPEAFAAKLRVLNNDGARRFGDKWEYDVEADIKAYVEIAEKV